MHDYIFFADDRSSIPTSTMHLADQIAKTNRVFWVNIYTRLPKLSLGEFQKAFRILTKRKATAAVNQQDTGSPIISVTPLQFPWFGIPGRKFNGFAAKRFYQKLAKQHNIQKPVFVTNFPCVVDAFRALRQIVLDAPQIYYCFDDFVEYPGFNKRHWHTMEQEFFRTVDGVAFTSRDLLENKKRPESLPTLYLPHGVDYEHFACERTAPKPIDALEKIKKPIVGFFGTIDSRNDLSIIVYLAKRFPQCSFAIIGRTDISITPLDGIDNVSYLDQVSYSALPQFAYYYDVGLIPYILNGFVKAINPLKLLEYFAAGLPVISSRIPEMIGMPGPLYFADTHEEFGNHLEEILRSDLSAMRLQAQEVARQNSWSARAESLMQFAEECKKDVNIARS